MFTFVRATVSGQWDLSAQGFGCSAIGATTGWRIHISLTGLVARYVIGAWIGTSLVVARMSQLPCNAAKNGLGVFGRRSRRRLAQALRRSFVIGMNRDLLELADAA